MLSRFLPGLRCVVRRTSSSFASSATTRPTTNPTTDYGLHLHNREQFNQQICPPPTTVTALRVPCRKVASIVKSINSSILKMPSRSNPNKKCQIHPDPSSTNYRVILLGPHVSKNLVGLDTKHLSLITDMLRSGDISEVEFSTHQQKKNKRNMAPRERNQKQLLQCLHKKNTKEAANFLHSLDKGAQQDKRLHSELLKAHVAQNELDSAMHLYRYAVLALNLTSDSTLQTETSSLVHKLVAQNRTQEAFDMILLTYQDRGWANSHTLRVRLYYDVLKQSSYVNKDFQLSQEIFSEMERRGDAQLLQPKAATSVYSLMLRIMFMAGASSRAQDLYTQLAARGNCVQNSSEMYAAMIKGLARCGQLESAEALFRDAVAEAETLNMGDMGDMGDSGWG